MKLYRTDTCVVCGECVRWEAPYFTPRSDPPLTSHYYTGMDKKLDPFHPADIFHLTHEFCRSVWPETMASNIISYWERVE